MSERLSILWNKPRGILSRAEKDEGHRTIVDLQIDRAFRTICPDTIIREAFLSVLLTPLTDIDEIVKRRKTIEIFSESPQLLDRLIELVQRLAVTKKSWDLERSRILASGNVNPQDKSLVLWTARGNLELTAHFLRIIIGYIREIHESLNMTGCTEGWLGGLKERTYRIACTKEIEEMLKFSDHLEKNLSNAHTYEIEFDFDDELRISPVFLRDFSFLRTVDKQQKKSRNLLLALIERTEKRGKKEDNSEKNEEKLELPDREISLGYMTGDWGLEMSARAVQECDRYMTSFLRILIDVFCGLEDELYFYKAALMHIKRLKERNVSVIYPELLPSEENTLKMRDLSDLLLLTESMSVLSVVPNDVNICQIGKETAGMLVTGKNNSGKTVFLRSVGTAVLLTQCGLPIPAKEAVISVRSKIFTTFAKGEGELQPLSSAGRFEEEVAQISTIIDRIEPCSLLLLNETFQTTAYDEGADGMAHILEYISALGCGFVFVTHLTKLKEIYRDKAGVVIMKTSEDPRTRYKLGIESEIK